ncbi:FAD/NAD(P)-binding domain-containing protein [Pholiota conissans]|uniref:FAD/NAD(P)-binding domain-containing protein n=1 Tax=Pholiota conissans TaxID=109636 RepID=A0A9P5YX21_9AGAR|nr:FAD/NAD(P)-binding domain-containing protein [Pholiota conissans]
MSEVNSTSADNISGHKIRVAIIGAGIGGLTLSAALGALSKKKNLEIDIYEAAFAITEVGAGITLWPRVWKTMKAIGLDEELVKFLPQAPDNSPRLVFQLRKADQKEGVSFHDVIMEGGSTTFHRADLQQALKDKMTGRLHLRHRISSVEERGDEVVIHFQDGSSATCDLLVGMDGIKSTVRKSLLLKQNLPNSPSIDPVWSGIIVYRGLVSRDALKRALPGHLALTTPMCYIGKRKHIVAYAISRSFINVAACVTDPTKKGMPYTGAPMSPEEIQKELMESFVGWEPEVQTLLHNIDHPGPLKWPIYQVIPLEHYASGRILIGGDAAHGMPPHQGAGASQAIEDAYILAHLLCSESATKKSVLQISEIYDQIRRPAGNRVLDASVAFGDLFELTFPGLDDFKEGDTDFDINTLYRIGKAADEGWEWTWKESIERDKRRALELLQSSVGSPWL